jgi:hypothetical protein
MSQNQSPSSLPWLGTLPSPTNKEFASAYAKGFAAMQKEWMQAVEHGQKWLDAEAKLGSDLVARVAAAKAIPEAASAYQEWMTRRIELFSKEWQKAVVDGQKFVNACQRIAGREANPDNR